MRPLIWPQPVINELSSCVQSAGAWSHHASSRLVSTLSALVDDPHNITSATGIVASRAWFQLAASVEALAVTLPQQPGALPAAGALAGSLLGLATGQVLSSFWQPDGRELPLRYDPDAIASYFARRPLEVLLRTGRILGPCSVFASQVLLDRAQGQVAANERRRARELVELIARLGPTAIKVSPVSSRRDVVRLAKVLYQASRIHLGRWRQASRLRA